jgi:anti-sigma factor RsiW
MDCKQARELLSAQLDVELGGSESIALEAHLQSCTECQAEFAEQARLRARMKDDVQYFRAPANLEKRIKAMLPQPAAPERERPRWTGSWLRWAPGLAGVLALAWGLSLTLNQPSPNEVVANELVASHVRSLMSNRMTDVASSDQHTVKPWFSGKLDYAPAVRDFTTQGYPLVGGRLDYVGGRPVATLIYRHRQHLIAVYEWPGREGKSIGLTAMSRQGYHLLSWSDNGMIHWAISDLAPNELTAFAKMLQTP